MTRLEGLAWILVVALLAGAGLYAGLSQKPGLGDSKGGAQSELGPVTGGATLAPSDFKLCK